MSRSGLTRAELVGTAVVGGAGLAAGAGLLTGGAGTASSRPSRAQDETILNFVLQIEDLQAAYYSAVLAAGRVVGEPRRFASVVGAHERAHAAFLRSAMGARARRPPRFEFGVAASDPGRFLDVARELEDLGVAAYDAGAPNLTPQSLAAAARIVSVEARHAAWIRDIAGALPAPDPTEPAKGLAQVVAAIRATGFLRP
jgi:hypothetical protein